MTDSAKRVVVIGATGNVGTAVLNALSQDASVSEIVGIARRRPDWTPPKTRWVEADVVTDDLVGHLRGADAVIHLAWAFQPTHQPMVTWEVNAVGSLRVFAAVADAGVPALVYSSSVGAYSPGPKDRAVDESWPTDSVPTAAYGREKAYVERALDTFEARHPDIRVVRLRPGFIFQVGAAAEQLRIFGGRLVPARLVRRRLIPVVPDTDGLRFQVLHADDVAEAFRLAVSRPVSGPFNVAADPVIGAAELAQVLGARPVKVPRPVLRAALDAAWHLRLVPASPDLLDLALEIPIMDTSRARRELGWEPRHSALDALRSFFEGLERGAGMPTEPLAPASSGGETVPPADSAGR